MTAINTLATLSDTRIVASLGLIVPPQVVLSTWTLGADLILSNASNAHMEDVTVLRVGDLNTIWDSLTVVGRVRDANLIVRVVWHWLAAWVRVVVGVCWARGEDLLSGLCRVRWVLRVHEDASWRRTLSFLLAWEDALSALLWHGLRGRVSGPPESSAVVVHSAQKVRLNAVEASVEDVTPSAWVESVLFSGAGKLLILIDIRLPWSNSLAARSTATAATRVTASAAAAWIAASTAAVLITSAWVTALILTTTILSARARIRRRLLSTSVAAATIASALCVASVCILTAELRQLGSHRLEVHVAWAGQWIVRSKLASLSHLIIVESLSQMIAHIGLGLFAENARVIDIAVLGVLVRSSRLASTVEFNRLQVGLLLLNLLLSSNDWQGSLLLNILKILNITDDDVVQWVERVERR